MSHERGHRTNSPPSSGNKAPHNNNKMDATDDINNSQRMKKVSVDSLSQLTTTDATEMSSVVPSRMDDRMSWQIANWDDMETSFDVNRKASCASRRTSCKSESSAASLGASSFYQSLINEFEADELLREISKASIEAEQHIMETKRKSMQKCLEEDEEAFANSLRSLALEVEKNKEKDANN